LFQYVLRRIAFALITSLALAAITFAIVHLIPGDPANTIAGPTASEATIERIRVQLGLDLPLHQQFGRYLRNLAQLDLGRSFQTGASVRAEIALSLPKTLYLSFGAIAIAILVGIPLGVLSAVRLNSFTDLSVMAFAMIGASLPNFWLGLLLMWFFSVELRWLPSMGATTPAHYILPSITLAMSSLALIARQTRSAMAEVLNQDYIRTARAKGLRGRVTVYKHGLRNAMIPVLTIVGVNFGVMLGGAVVVESVFSIRGLGQLVVNGILQRDYPVIQAGVLVFALNFTLVNLLVDLVYGYLDPRIKYA